jgi:hypothetical protein
MALNSSWPAGRVLLADTDASLSAKGTSGSAKGRTGDRVIAQGLGGQSTAACADKGALSVILDKASRQGG